MTASDAKLVTFRDVLQQRTRKVTAQDPIEATESFIKYGQPWPINEDKDGKESPPEKKQKLSGSKEASKEVLKKVHDDQFDTDKYLSIQLMSRKELNEDTSVYTFKHGLKSVADFNVGTGQHLLCAFVLEDGVVERPYAITRPIGADKDDGTIDILVKTALPTEKDPGGTLTNILSSLESDRADEMLVRGPEGPIVYNGDGVFAIEIDGKKKDVKCRRINFVSGGTGMTPIYATIRAILETDKSDHVEVRFIDANVNKSEILLKDHLQELVKEHSRLQVTHVLEHPDEDWEGEKGLVDEDKMRRHLFSAEEGVVSLVCGPPPMMEAAKKGLTQMGFKENTSFFHY